MRNITSYLDNDLNKSITKQCKEVGCRRTDVLGFIIESQDIIEEIVEEMLSNPEVVLSLLSLKNNKKHVSILVNSDRDLKEILSEYNININQFLYYIATNNIIIKLKDVLPDNLKMKKSK